MNSEVTGIKCMSLVHDTLGTFLLGDMLARDGLVLGDIITQLSRGYWLSPGGCTICLWPEKSKQDCKAHLQHVTLSALSGLLIQRGQLMSAVVSLATSETGDLHTGTCSVTCPCLQASAVSTRSLVLIFQGLRVIYQCSLQSVTLLPVSFLRL